MPRARSARCAPACIPATRPPPGTRCSSWPARCPGSVALPLSPAHADLELPDALRGPRRAGAAAGTPCWPTCTSRRARSTCSRAARARPGRGDGLGAAGRPGAPDRDRRPRVRAAHVRVRDVRARRGCRHPAASPTCRAPAARCWAGRGSRSAVGHGGAGAAAAFAAWAAGDDVQRELVAPAGGQPAAPPPGSTRRSTPSPAASTRRRAPRSKARGRGRASRGGRRFQLGAGKLLTRALDEHRPQSTTRAELQALHDYHLRRAA